MLKRLNGWQRLSVVLGVLWTLWVGLVAWDRWPRELCCEDERGYLDGFTIEYYESRFLAETSLEAFGLALAFWLLPPLALYVAGLTVGWVYRGFRSPPATPH